LNCTDQTGVGLPQHLAVGVRPGFRRVRTQRNGLVIKSTSEIRAKRATETIARKAKTKNLDGVTLAYFDLTMSCVRCHQHTPEERDAALPVPLSDRTIGFARPSREP
jgi:hypothetical protein